MVPKSVRIELMKRKAVFIVVSFKSYSSIYHNFIT